LHGGCLGSVPLGHGGGVALAAGFGWCRGPSRQGCWRHQFREVVSDGATKRRKVFSGRETECAHLSLHLIAYRFSQVFRVLATLLVHLWSLTQIAELRD
jgi:hypothetical protein